MFSLLPATVNCSPQTPWSFETGLVGSGSAISSTGKRPWSERKSEGVCSSIYLIEYSRARERARLPLEERRCWRSAFSSSSFGRDQKSWPGFGAGGPNKAGISKDHRLAVVSTFLFIFA